MITDDLLPHRSPSETAAVVIAENDDLEDQWYQRWCGWFHANYFIPADPDHSPQSKLRYYTPEKSWYMYQELTGAYRLLTPPQLKAIFFAWSDTVEGDHGKFKTTDAIVAHAFTRLQSYPTVEYTGAWDNDSNIENCLDGLLNLQTLTKSPHTPFYLSKKPIPRNYREPTIWAKQIVTAILTNLCSTPKHGDRLRKFWALMVHKDHTQELFLMSYGKRGSGKSTALNIPANLFGEDLTSATVFYKLGTRFGLKECYDKRVNVCPEMSVKSLKNAEVGMMKTLTGGESGADGFVEVEKKGLDSFKYPIQCFFLFGINQLPEFADEVSGEIESIMRRVCLIEYTDAQKPCPEYKSLMKDPDFLDDLYWILLHEPIEPIKVPDQEQFITANLDEWLTNCSPMLRMIKNCFKYSEFDSIAVKNVLEKITEEYEAESLIPPHNLQQEITYALRGMKIYRDEERGLKASYHNIAYLNPSPKEQTNVMRNTVMAEHTLEDTSPLIRPAVIPFEKKSPPMNPPEEYLPPDDIKIVEPPKNPKPADP